MPRDHALTEFLARALSQKEASLLITRAPDRAIRALEAEGFANLQDPRRLETAGKRYLWATPENAKEIYDLAAEYGSGQITFFDEAAKKPVWINPAYKNSAIVVVISRRDLETVEASGLPLRSITGLALQAA